MPMQPLTIVQGSRADWTLQAPKRNRSPATSFLASDALSCKLWLGLDGSTVLTPAVAWVDYTTGKLTITILASDSAQLEQLAEYRLQVWVTRGTDTGCIVDCSLKVLPSPGSSTQSITAYTTYQEILDVAPWVQRIQDLDAQQTGYYRQRIKSREWIEGIIVSNDRGGSAGLYGRHSDLGMSFGSGGGRRGLGPSSTLRRYLAENKLIVTPKVKEICAYHTAGLIGLATLGQTGQHAALGAYCRDEAERLVVCLTAEIDTNADGVGEIFIPLTSTNTRFT